MDYVVALLTDLNLWKAFFAVGGTVLVVYGLRWYGKIPTSRLDWFGPDLNVLAFGALVDAGVAALSGDTYWPTYPVATLPPPGSILAVLFLANCFFMLANFKLAEAAKSQRNQTKAGIMRFAVISLGLLSGGMVIGLRAKWG